MNTLSVEQLLKNRYFQAGETSWEDLATRVAVCLASVEDEDHIIKHYKEKFYDIIASKDFIPNTPMLVNAGTKIQYMSACIVLPIEDSMDSIFETLKLAAMLTKSGAGTGFSFSRLRPRGDVVGSTNGVSSGPISFMKIFDQATEEIKQGGRRKGANMGLLDVHHPDIMEFIKCKDDPTELNNFNISVGVTDVFMRAVKDDKSYLLVNPRRVEIFDYLDIDRTGEISARKVWNAIVEQVHKNGEPGLVFLDTINRHHPLEDVIEGVNVCAEEPLLPYEQCVLGAVHLGHMVKNNSIDYKKLDKTILLGVRLLDNAIDLNVYPDKRIEEMAKKNRKIGLGVMGWGEMLARLGLVYGSDESIELAEKLSKWINAHAIIASQILSDEKGPFPNIENSSIETYRRNAVVTTAAPTGTRSLIADTTSGIEPIYSVEDAYHTDNEGNKTSLAHGFMSEVNPDVLVGAHDVTWEQHVRMQAAWQTSIGASISKTINMKSDAPIKDVSDALMMAYDMGCKGITIYRDKSRNNQVLKKSKDAIEVRERGQITPSPSNAAARKLKFKTGCGTLYLFPIFDDEGNIIEMFTESKGGGCKATIEALSRLASVSLRSGVSLSTLIDQFLSVKCDTYVSAKRKNAEIAKGISCPSAIGFKLMEMLSIEPVDSESGDLCPECKKRLSRESGCVMCMNCGWSRCE